MSLIQVQVGAPGKQPDNTTPNLLGGGSGELIQSPLNAEYYTLASRGMIFSGNQAAAGAAVPVYTSTTQQCGLLNPGSSGVNLVPVRLNIGYVSTTGAPGSFAIGYITTGGGVVATGGAGVTVATTTVPANCLLGGKAAKGIFMSASITTAAPSLLMQIGVSQLTTTGATTSTVFFDGKYDFNGQVVMPPGTGIFVSGNIALLTLCVCSIVWAEVPIS